MEAAQVLDLSKSGTKNIERKLIKNYKRKLRIRKRMLKLRKDCYLDQK